MNNTSPPAATVTTTSSDRRRLTLPAWVPGIGLTIGLAIVAILLSTIEERLIGVAVIEALVLALLLGVVARNLLGTRAAPFSPGAGLAAKQVLEVGVALLGASVDLRQILASGPGLALLIVAGVTGGLAVSYLAGQRLGLGTRLAILVAVGNAICGNSAIAAVAPVIRAEKREVASAIALTAVLGVCLVLALPLTIAAFGLSHYQYGIVAGMSVYAVPQVVAAAFPVSQLSGEVATLTKLGRVMLLGPVVLFFALLFRGGETKRGIGTYVPWFAAVFLVLAAIRSLGILPDAPANLARDLARILTIVAMAGLGFGVDLGTVRQVGPRVAVAVILSLSFMTALSLGMVRLVG